MTEFLIYRNDHLSCIVNDDVAEATLDLLQDCYPLDSWELRKKIEKEDE